MFFGEAKELSSDVIQAVLSHVISRYSLSVTGSKRYCLLEASS